MNETDAQHRERMQTLAAEMQAKTRAARTKRGLLIVHTGHGKGKTTAAFGMLARALAHGRRCAVLQFIKSGNDAVEKTLRGPQLEWRQVGDGFTWDTQDRAADIARGREGWALALGWLRDPAVQFIVLDELNVMLAYEYLPLDEVLAALRARPEGQHVVVTGRDAPPALVELADLVTEMRVVKHPFAAGVQAQAGIEF
ncbi:MAG: cob(I)yrinic acid a,c-diamide adenosyltransferase [Opitutae bacterium]|nr:cob(I)yrinic acid a,c-diamide adenosyltransferase [Opitutae bacterium]